MFCWLVYCVVTHFLFDTTDKLKHVLAHLSRRLKWNIAIARRPSGVSFRNFDFSETAERNSTKLDRKQDLNVFYQMWVFRADRKYKMVALASDWLRHFWLLLWDCWREARSKRLLLSLCFSGRSGKKSKWPPWPLIGWDIFDFSSETALNGIQRNLTDCRISTSSTNFVFLCRSEKLNGRLGLWLADTFSNSPH